MPNPSTDVSLSQGNWKKRLKRLAYFVLFAGVLSLLGLVIVWWAFISYLQTDERKVFEHVELLNNGTLAFDQADFSLFKTFPAASFTLKNIAIQDAAAEDSDEILIQLEQLSIHLSFKDWWDDPLHETLLQIDTIDLKKGRIHLFKDSTGYGNLEALIKKKIDQDSEKKPYKLKVETQNTFVQFSEIDFHLIDEIKNSHIDIQVDTLSAILNIKDQHLVAHTDFVILTNQVSFNTQKGTYVPNSRLQGACMIDYQEGNLEIQPFDLVINEQCFTFSILTKIRENDASVITLENHNTDLSAARPLLPFSIEEQIKNYQILQPFYSKTTIETAFEANDHPIVTIDFQLREQDIFVDKFGYSKVSLDGKFVNRIYADDRAQTEARKRWRLEFADIQGSYQGFNMQTDTVLITKTEDNEINLKTQLKVTGKAAAISSWLENDQFFFKKGQFALYADVDGSLNDYEQLVKTTDVDLDISEFSVYYQPAHVAFPFESLQLKKMAGDADFKIVGNTIEQQHRYLADGRVQNFPALLLASIKERSKSDVQLHAPKISWTDFINLFGDNGYLNKEDNTFTASKSDQQKKASLKQTLQGLQDDFQPTLAITIDTLQYYNALALHDFQTGIHFQNKDTLVLEKTSFQYQNGQVEVQAKLDISQPQRTPFELDMQIERLNLQTMLPALNYLNISLLKELKNLPASMTVSIKHRGILDDEKGLMPNSSEGEITFLLEQGEELMGKITYQSSLYFAPEDLQHAPITRTQIHLEGAPHLFNDFFKTNQFFFQNGRFQTQVHYEGDIYDLQELLAKAKVDLSMKDSEIYYAPGDVHFPIPHLDLLVKRDSAAFTFQLRSDSLYQALDFVGNIHPISELVIGDTGHPIATNVNIVAQKLSYGNLKYLLAQQKKPAYTAKAATKSNKSTIKSLLQRFRPHVHLQIDTLIYSDKIVLQQLESGMYLSNNNQLVLENTGFQFQDGNVKLLGEFDFNPTTHTPFQTEFVTDDLNIGKLLAGFNYLSLPSLQNIEKLTGEINIDLHFSGRINQAGTALITAYNEGLLRFNLRNLQVVGFEPLENLAAKVLMKKRFADLRFAPIMNTFRIKGDKLHFPLTEIQSTAFNLFLEGQLSYGDDTNLWASLPLGELFFNDPDELPKKTGYHARPLKIHAEVTSDENGDNQFKLHFTKKKFYEQRGILEHYRRERQRYRLQRRKGGG